ncbi:hypothetical protein J6Y50_07285 [bacterium]|nr:hypothetical protein [bacterium]
MMSICTTICMTIIKFFATILATILAKKGVNIAFGKIANFIKNFINNDFDATLKDAKFKEFKQEVLENYYGKDSFTEVKGKTFPTFCFKSAKKEYAGNDIRKYDCLSNPNELNAKFDKREHQNYRQRYYLLYSQIMKQKVVAGNRPGFMLDRLECDENGNVVSFQTHVGTYAENIYTSHVLEYELYRAYKKFGKDFNWKKIRKFMKTRNEIHRSIMPYRELKTPEETKEFLKSGAGRHSLLSVQMLVLMKENVKNENGEIIKKRYKILLIQRSETVAIAPGYYQFVPSGGFEVFCDCPQGYSAEGIRDNLSAGCAVFREYMEEILGEKEFEGEGRGHVNEILMNNPRIAEINKMLADGTAQFEFLGSVVDLTVLRHELSFALVIDDPAYVKKMFPGNTEAAGYQFVNDVYLDNFEKKENIWNNLHWSSAAMWKLFTESDLYKKLKPNSDRNESSQK